MSATPLPDPPSAAEPAAAVEPASAVTVDLTASGTDGEETPVRALGRIIGGLATMLVGGIVALVLFAAYIGGAFIPAIADWVDLFGDGLLYIAAIAAGIAITGFEVLRRGRKARAASASPASAIAGTLGAVGAVTTEPGDNAVGPALADPSGSPDPTGAETHL
jgi:TM2 domain-containing membrane protein YozV